MRSFRARAPLLLCAFVIALPTAAEPSPAPQECTLAKTLKVSIKRGGTSAWEVVPAGARLSLIARGSTWSDVIVAQGTGRASTAVLDGACTFAAATPTPAAPAEAPAVVAPAAATPAVPEAPLAAPVAATPVAAAAATTPLTTPAPTTTTAEVVPLIVEPAPPQVPPEAAQAVLVPKRLVAILDFKAGIGAEGVAEALTTIVTAEVGAREGLKSLSRNELKAIVANQANAALMGCDSVACAADLAKLANAELVIAGTVEKLGTAHVLSITLIDPAVPAVLDRQEVAWRGNPNEMVALARPYVDRLFADGKAASYQGALEVFAPNGALVIVDGKAVGDAPLKAPIHELATGVHTIDVTQAGFSSHNREVVIARGETTIARVELVEEPFYSQWWFWTATGGSVLVAGGVVAGITTLGVFESIKDKPAKLILGPAAP